MPTTETTTPPWLVEGAQIVVWHSGGLSNNENPRAQITTVTKVGKAWFSVEALEVKINIARMQSPDQGGKMSHWCYRAASTESEEGAQMLARTRRKQLYSNVTVGIMQWERQPTNDSRVALIDALTALGEVMDA